MNKMYGLTDGWRERGKEGWTDRWIDGPTDELIDRRTDVPMNELKNELIN